ncbi:MAG: carboxypeptidase-like regulatory domain-containing protein [Rhodothermales bacterium]
MLLSSIGCLSDAERSNPLDPLSEDFENVGIFEGLTTRFYPPHSPVRNVEVMLLPGPYITDSDADGRFVFRNIPAGEYRVSARKDGFVSAPDSIVLVAGGGNPDMEIRLDGLPTVTSFELRTVHIDRWWPGELFQLEIVAMVEDPDGLSDISLVEFAIPAFGFRDELSATGIAGRYQETIVADSLPGGNLHALLGKEIVLHVHDAAGFETASDPKFLVRVIDATPVAVEPQAQEFIDDGRPLLVWDDAALPFEYTYRIDIVLDQANVQNVVLTIADIPPDRTSHQLETPLASGTYFWTISVVDAFGNRSRSKEAGFIVP